MTKGTGFWSTVIFPYVSYVAMFLGMGLISGAIVHMPMAPGRYTVIALIGAVMFGAASFVNDLAKAENLTPGAIVRSLLFSLLLSVGIGMMSGGIQHFSDNPTYSAMLIPIGFGVSLFSHILKSGIKLSVKRTYAVILLFVALVLPLSMSLNYMAQTTGWVETEDGHGHGH